MSAAPNPGVYTDVSFEDYLSWDCASASRLSDLLRSREYCRHRIDNPSEPTEAMLVGTAIHCALGEPDRFAQTYRLRPPGDGRTKAVKEARDALEAQGCILLKEDAWEACWRIRENVAAHSALSELVRKSTGVEVSAVADLVLPDGRTVRVKVRPDLLSIQGQFQLDWKSTADPTPDAFGRQAISYGYHRSAALYLDALRALDSLPMRWYVLGALAKDAPYEVAAYQVSDELIDAGRAEYQALLKVYADCQDSGNWTTPQTSHQLSLPAWMAKRLQTQEVAA